jgi:hypothetical protein
VVTEEINECSGKGQIRRVFPNLIVFSAKLFLATHVELVYVCVTQPAEAGC